MEEETVQTREERRNAETLRMRDNWLSLAFFLLVLPYMECLVLIASPDGGASGLVLLRGLFAGAAVGLLNWLISLLLPKKGGWTAVPAALFFAWAAVAFAEICVRDFFMTYYGLNFMLGMTGEIAGDFLSMAFSVIFGHILWLLALLLPVMILVVLHKYLMPVRISTFRVLRLLPLWALLGVVVLQGIAVGLCHIGDHSYYAGDYSTNGAMPRYGLVNTMRLELEYAVFGQPSDLPAEDFSAETSEEEPATEDTADEEPAEEAPAEEVEETPVVYGDNVMDIDFDALAESDTDKTLKSMDEYYASQIPTKQNEYTGMFAGKNLIVLTAEAFSYAVIDKDRTPALYKLANEGFVFNNYYQPDWTQSTTGGEFAAMSGIIPNWFGSKTAYNASIGKSMPFALGWMMSEAGYTVTAFHDNSNTYYKRNLTHPNMGYTNFVAIGSGLEIPSADLWPESDLDMMEATVDDQIQSYLDTGTPFHAYYMTVSGHCNYGFGVNKMSAKNEAVTEDIDASETVRAYIACQQELEYALEYLLQELDNAGIADDTVIVMTADHYPYAMSEGTDKDYYVELTGVDDTEKDTSRYHNTLILWSGSMEEPVEVDTPCTAIDILPTVLNLFGLEYDSRLLSGRDILAPDVEVGQVASNMHVAIFADTGSGSSWRTAAGTYEASTNTFTPEDGVTVPDDYVKQVSALVKNRYTYAKHLIQEDYFAHVLPDALSSETGSD